MSKVNNRGVNQLLSLLGEADRARILGRCEKVSLDIEAVLYEAGAAMGEVYFPLSGMVSMVIDNEDGGTIEVGVIGNEGMVGSSSALDADRSHVKALIQVQGEFLRMGVRDFKLELKRTSVRQ